jgi:ABC-2 type transport system ATP-binding protein
MVSPAAVVQAWGLRKRYRARDPLAVDGVSFSIGTGQALGLLGPNGAGKSTIVKMLTGLTRPDGGHVRLFGSSPGDSGARSQLGFVPEDPDFPRFLRAGEVLDYFARLLGLPAADRVRRIPEVLEWARLAGETRQVRHYSKGMKQRLGLAQAIIGRPRLLILDEPTADLDPVGRHDVREMISGFKSQGTSILLNSHLLSEVELVCDTVAIMAAGRILREGPIHDVVPAGRTLEEVFMDLVQAGSEPRDASMPSFMRARPGEAD